MLLPIFPLPDVVHFPGTRLPLHIFEPRYRQMVAELLELPAAERRVGMILVARDAETRELELLEPGTAGRLVEHEPLPDGRSNIVLAGEFRFAIEREVDGKPYRRAVVRPLPDGTPLEAEEEAAELQRRILDLALPVARECVERCGFALDDLAGLGRPRRLPILVNRLAAALDLPPLRKQALLAEPVVARAASVAGILRSRVAVLDALRPFRGQSRRPELQ